MNAIKSATPLSFNPKIITRIQEVLNQAQAGDYVVLDWDHTCVFGDCQDSVYRYQLTHLEFKLSPEQIASQLSHHSDFKILEARFIELSRTVLELKEFHSPSELQALLAHQDFVGLGLRLNELYLSHAEIGPRFAYPWILTWLEGYSDSEISKMATTALTEAVRTPVHQARFGSSSDCKATHQVGIRLQPEIQWLVERLREKGVRIYVVTASLEIVIQSIACDPYFGYSIPKENIKGMRFPLPPQSIMTWRAGKVEMIRKEIEQSRDPLIVIGDSDGDYEMLTRFPNLKCGIIIEKSRKGDIGKLIQDPRYFVQKRNLSTGEWILG